MNSRSPMLCGIASDAPRASGSNTDACNARGMVPSFCASRSGSYSPVTFPLTATCTTTSGLTEDPDELVPIQVGLSSVARHRLGQHFVDGFIEPGDALQVGLAGALVEPQHGRPQGAELGEYLARGKSMLKPALGMQTSGRLHHICGDAPT